MGTEQGLYAELVMIRQKDLNNNDNKGKYQEI